MRIRFWSKVNMIPCGGCWLWTGVTTRAGYGQFAVSHGQMKYAHRLAFEWERGAIPEGLQVDHLCFNPSCVNPEHLEAVTQAENLRRAAKRITHCPRGHPYFGRNLSISKQGSRLCKECNRLRVSRLRKARRAALS